MPSPRGIRPKTRKILPRVPLSGTVLKTARSLLQRTSSVLSACPAILSRAAARGASATAGASVVSYLFHALLSAANRPSLIAARISRISDSMKERL